MTLCKSLWALYRVMWALNSNKSTIQGTVTYIYIRHYEFYKKHYDLYTVPYETDISRIGDLCQHCMLYTRCIMRCIEETVKSTQDIMSSYQGVLWSTYYYYSVDSIPCTLWTLDMVSSAQGSGGSQRSLCPLIRSTLSYTEVY